MKMTKTLSVLMTGLMACAAQAADYYVSSKGDDDNDGRSPETAVQTIDKAFDLWGGDGRQQNLREARHLHDG